MKLENVVPGLRVRLLSGSRPEGTIIYTDHIFYPDNSSGVGPLVLVKWDGSGPIADRQNLVAIEELEEILKDGLTVLFEVVDGSSTD